MNVAARVASAVIGAIVVVYIGYVIGESHAFRTAVQRDARNLGYPVERIRSYSTWPLEYHSAALKQASDPRQAEALVLGADTVIYFLTPVTSLKRDTVLIQVFRFRLGPRLGAISVRYSPAGDVVVEEGEWLPSNRYNVSREQAILWFTARRPG